MANVTLTVYQLARTGLNLSDNKTTVVTTNTYYMPNNGSAFLHVNNVIASPCTVTIDVPATVDGLTVADRTVIVPASELEVIGPFPPSQYNDSNGQVKFTFDQAAEIVAVHF